MAERKKLLLALHSPLYAPLYLAKQLSLGSFDRIDFEYRPMHSGRGDPLVRDVLSNKRKDKTYIAAVCDPFRALMAGPSLQRPKIIGGLVKHMTYYLVNHDKTCPSASISKLPDLFEKLIVHPKYMTGYAVMRHLLHSHTPSCDHNRILYHKTFPGFEELHYSSLRSSVFGRRARYRGRDFAFLTTNPIFLFDTPREVTITLSTIAAYKDCLMTSIVVGEESAASIEHRDDISELIGGVKEAIDLIRHDPLKAAYHIRHFSSDPLVPFSFRAADLEQLENVIDHLRSNDTYAVDCKISSTQVERSIAIRNVSLNDNPDKEHLIDFSEWRNYFDPQYIIDETPSAQSTQIPALEPYPKWVKDIVYDYGNSIPSVERSGISNVIAAIVSVSAALGGTLLTFGVSGLLPGLGKVSADAAAMQASLMGRYSTAISIFLFVLSLFLVIKFVFSFRKRVISFLVELLFLLSAMYGFSGFSYYFFGQAISDNIFATVLASGSILFFSRHASTARRIWRSLALFRQENSARLWAILRPWLVMSFGRLR